MGYNLTDFIGIINSVIPESYLPYFILVVYTLLIVVYAVVVWKIYRFLAKRDILELNLSKYNVLENYKSKKFKAGFLYFIEYILIIPILVVLWFSFLSLALLLIAEIEDVSQIMLISAAVITSIRIISYYSEDLAKELALYFPFVLLSVAILEPGFFSFPDLVSRFMEIPSLVYSILIYMGFIAGIEILMRLIFLIFRSDN